MTPVVATLPVLKSLLHGGLGGWDEILLTAGSIVIGIALATVLKPKGDAVRGEGEPGGADAREEAAGGDEAGASGEDLPEGRERR